MALLSPSLILLTYRFEKASFVLENGSGLPITFDSPVIPSTAKPWYLDHYNIGLSLKNPDLLADVRERIQHDFRGYAFFTNWYDSKSRRYHVVIRHNSVYAKSRDYVPDNDMKALGTGKKNSVDKP